MKIASCELNGQTGHEAGRQLLARLYRAETGQDLPPIRVTDRGKPYFEGENWYFSISHTKRHAFCVLSNRPVGIDAEELDRNIDLRLAEKILSPGEKAQFASAADKRLALLTFWVLKEASVKLSGEGLRGYPNQTDFSLDDPRVTEMDGCLVAVMGGKTMLEKMGEFFDARLDGYEEHQLTCIESAREFYPFTASCLPGGPGVHILDLGCGTGLELTYYFARVPDACVTGIDLAPGMLRALREKFPDKALNLINGSYFEVSLGEGIYDGAVSVESLHHFTKDEKLPLYRRLHASLKDGACFILTDYFAPTGEYERFYRQELLRLKREQGIGDGEFYHYDTPLTLEHEIQALTEAGFSKVEVLNGWANTHTLKATK